MHEHEKKLLVFLGENMWQICAFGTLWTQDWCTLTHIFLPCFYATHFMSKFFVKLRFNCTRFTCKTCGKFWQSVVTRNLSIWRSFKNIGKPFTLVVNSIFRHLLFRDLRLNMHCMAYVEYKNLLFLVEVKDNLRSPGTNLVEPSLIFIGRQTMSAYSSWDVALTIPDNTNETELRKLWQVSLAQDFLKALSPPPPKIFSYLISSPTVLSQNWIGQRGLFHLILSGSVQSIYGYHRKYMRERKI